MQSSTALATAARARSTSKQGTAVATTAPNGAQNTGASIKAGDVTLGARGTQFGASVGAGGAGATDLEAFVIEGDVAVSGLTAGHVAQDLAIGPSQRSGGQVDHRGAL